jgi:hypothetical protein
MSNTTTSLDETIAHAVQAKINATVFEALAGDATLSAYVNAAMQQPVEVKSGYYDRRRTTFLTEALNVAIQEATKDAVADAVKAEAEMIRKHVADAIKAQASEIAGVLVNSLAEAAAAHKYRITISQNG